MVVLNAVIFAMIELLNYDNGKSTENISGIKVLSKHQSSFLQLITSLSSIICHSVH